jgi:hypothetical protein
VLKKKCPLPFDSYDDCLACTRKAGVGASCSPKQRQEYCRGKAAFPVAPVL